jgi:hypothetical protein
MLTIFTTPKAFHGHSAIIQTNAIKSWLALQPQPEIILFGNDEGVAGIASEFNLRHIPEVACNSSGTPLVSSMFSIAQAIGRNPITCYVNADIIFMSDFLPAVQRVNRNQFLIIGQRWDLEINEPLNFNDAGWESDLRTRIAGSGTLHPKSGIDYFVFSRGLYQNIPPFAIGRPIWDNWMIYQARKLGVPVIDATRSITAVHQNHDYSHHPDGWAGVWQGKESRNNVSLLGSRNNSFTIEYATHMVTSRGLKPAITPKHLYFRLRALPVLHPRAAFLLAPFKGVESVSRVFNKMIRTK